MTNTGSVLSLVVALLCPIQILSGGLPPALETQPMADRIIQGHQAEFIVGSSDFTARWRWQKDGLDVPGATSTKLLLKHVQPTDSGLYRAIATNAAGDAESISRSARLTVIPQTAGPGAVDNTFLDTLGTPEKLMVRALLPLAGGRTLVAACFAQPLTGRWQEQCRIYRLLPDGRIDETFPVLIAKGQTKDRTDQLPSENRTVTSMIWQGGKILIGGSLTAWNQGGADVPVNRLLRIETTGLRDPTFINPTDLTSEIRALEVLPSSNDVLLGTIITPFLRRLPVNGAATPSAWNGGGAIDFRVNAVCALPDGRVAVAGALGTQFRGFMLLLANGNRDLSFPNLAGLDDEVLCVTPRLAANNQTLLGFWLGGKFTKVHNVTQRNLALVNADGSLTSGFGGAGQLNGPVQAMALQSGALFIGGGFTNLAPRVHKLDALTGLADPAWDSAGFQRDVLCLATDNVGLLVGGKFTQPHDGLARLLTTWPVVVTPQLAPPSGQTASQGDSASLTAEITGSRARAFQWYRDGQWQRTTKRPELHLPHFKSETAGQYQVSITNPQGIFLSATAPVSVQPTHYGRRRLYVATATIPIPLLPDEGTLTLAIQNPVPAGVSVEEMRVVIALDHEDVNDLEITLERPGGLDLATLFDQHGSGADLDHTVFATTARRVLADANGPFAGSYQPTDPLALRTLTTRLDATGLILRITDHGTDGIIGRVSYAAVEIYTNAPPTLAAWAQFHQLPATPTLTTDHNHNGIPDGLEFAFNTQAPSPLTIFPNAEMVHPQWSLPAGITLSYEATDNLSQWQPLLPISWSLLSRDPDTGLDLVRPRFRWPSGNAPQFLRVRVTQP